MSTKPPRNPFQSGFHPLKPQVEGKAVPKMTQVAGKRIGGAQRAEFARQQAKRDAKRG
jgi:hypothetical protein